MNAFRILIFSPLLSGFLVGCGDETMVSPVDLTPLTLNQKVLTFPVVPSYVAAYQRSMANPNIIEPVNRVISLNEYDQVVEPELSADRTTAMSLITGIGVEAVFDGRDSNNNPVEMMLPIRMGIVAREWDEEKKTFKSTTRTFSAQGQDLTRTQSWVFGNDQLPNFLITGMALRLREGRIKKLELRKTRLNNIQQPLFGSPMTSQTRVELPAGWAAVGLIIGIDRANMTQPPREPFIEDVMINLGQLIER